MVLHLLPVAGVAVVVAEEALEADRVVEAAVVEVAWKVVAGRDGMLLPETRFPLLIYSGSEIFNLHLVSRCLWLYN